MPQAVRAEVAAAAADILMNSLLSIAIVSDGFVNFMSLYINCAEGACGAEVLAGATADAAFLVHNGNLQTIGIASPVLEFGIAISIDHLDCSGWTMTSAVAACDTISEHYTVVSHPNGMTYLR